MGKLVVKRFPLTPQSYHPKVIKTGKLTTTKKPAQENAVPAASSPASSPTLAAAGDSPATRRLSSEMQVSLATDDRVAEARFLLVRAKTYLKKGAKNTSREVIKNVVEVVDRLYQLVKEASIGLPQVQHQSVQDLEKLLVKQNKLIEENGHKIELLRDSVERKSYASVVSDGPSVQKPAQITLHSVVVSAKNQEESGDVVLDMIKKRQMPKTEE